jgi:hypothetical protein
MSRKPSGEGQSPHSKACPIIQSNLLQILPTSFRGRKKEGKGGRKRGKEEREKEEESRRGGKREGIVVSLSSLLFCLSHE